MEVTVFDFVGVGIMVLVLILFGFLTWRAQKRVLRWGGAIICGLLTLLLALVTGAALYGFVQINKTYSNPVADIKVAGTPEQLARGTKLANT
jgi:multisubunit Na+/H+ antiporter MnhB subunit